MKKNNPFAGFRRGMGIGGWLTNYKRFHVLPEAWRHTITVGDLEHFESYITEDDIRRIASSLPPNAAFRYQLKAVLRSFRTPTPR